MAARGPVAAPGPAPLLLALETATAAVSVALLRGEELLDERAAPRDRSCAETLLPAVEALLSRAGVGLDQLEAFAVSVGPGSFTSLRVGIASLKGLAFGGAQPVAAVPTLEALALAAPAKSGPVVAMLDARRGEVYAAGPGLPEGVYDADELAARLRAPCVLVGDGVEIVGAELRERLGRDVTLVPPPAGDPAARHVGRLGARLLAGGHAVDVADLVPRYVRRAEAEVKRTGERFEA